MPRALQCGASRFIPISEVRQGPPNRCVSFSSSSFFNIFFIFLGRLIGQSSQIFVALSCLYLLVHVFTFSCLVRFWVFDLSLYRYIYLSVCPSVRPSLCHLSKEVEQYYYYYFCMYNIVSGVFVMI